jgi:hypothetical protein
MQHALVSIPLKYHGSGLNSEGTCSFRSFSRRIFSRACQIRVQTASHWVRLCGIRTRGRSRGRTPRRPQASHRTPRSASAQRMRPSGVAERCTRLPVCSRPRLQRHGRRPCSTQNSSTSALFPLCTSTSLAASPRLPRGPPRRQACPAPQAQWALGAAWWPCRVPKDTPLTMVARGTTRPSGSSQW